MHELQKLLIKRLFENNGTNYAQLTHGYDQEDNIIYHLNKLIESEIVRKEVGLYYLTSKGVKERGKFDIESLDEPDAKSLFFGFVCQYKDRFLLRSHPNASENFYNLPSGKPEFGESYESSVTEMFEKLTGLSFGPERFQYNSLHLKRVMASNGDIVFDDAFVVFDVTLKREEIENLDLVEDIEWYNIKEINDIGVIWPEVDICIQKKNWNQFNSYDIVCDYVSDKVIY